MPRWLVIVIVVMIVGCTCCVMTTIGLRGYLRSALLGGFGLFAEYPEPSSLPPPVEEPIEDVLARLEATLTERAPAVLESLRPGLTDAEIDALLDGTGVTLPEELRAFYRWRNGAQTRVYLHSTYFYEIGHMVPLEDAIASHVHVRDAAGSAGVYWKNWLLILDDGAGDGFLVDLSRTPERGMWVDVFHEDGDFRFFPSLATFLTAVELRWANGIYFVDEHGNVQTDYDRHDEHWAEYSTHVWHGYGG